MSSETLSKKAALAAVEKLLECLTRLEVQISVDFPYSKLNEGGLEVWLKVEVKDGEHACAWGILTELDFAGPLLGSKPGISLMISLEEPGEITQDFVNEVIFTEISNLLHSWNACSIVCTLDCDVLADELQRGSPANITVALNLLRAGSFCVKAKPVSGQPVCLYFDDRTRHFRELVSDETVAEIVKAADSAGEETWMDRKRLF